MRVVISSSASVRFAAAREFLAGHPPGSEVVIVGASRGAADDLARDVGRRAGATFGLTRFSLTEVAARAAASTLAGTRRVPGSSAGAEAMAARAVFDAVAAGELAYFGPVASLPGFPKALARTVHELRLTGVTADRLRATDAASIGDLAGLLTRIEEQLANGAVDDRAALFRMAAEACRAGQVRWAALPLVFLDLPLDSRAEQEFAAALAARSPGVLATIPEDDAAALDALRSMGATIFVDLLTQSQVSRMSRLSRVSRPRAAVRPRRRCGDSRASRRTP